MSSAYADGREARRDGLTWEDNPYNELTERDSYYDWDAGWTDQDEEWKDHRRAIRHHREYD